MMFNSPVTTWLGIAYEVLVLILQAMKDQPIPATPEEWGILAAKVFPGLIAFASKDWNKTNAVQANPTPQTAPVAPITTMVEPIVPPKG